MNESQKIPDDAALAAYTAEVITLASSLTKKNSEPEYNDSLIPILALSEARKVLNNIDKYLVRGGTIDEVTTHYNTALEILEDTEFQYQLTKTAMQEFMQGYRFSLIDSAPDIIRSALTRQLSGGNTQLPDHP